jgi:hypothetical protein
VAWVDEIAVQPASIVASRTKRMPAAHRKVGAVWQITISRG